MHNIRITQLQVGTKAADQIGQMREVIAVTRLKGGNIQVKFDYNIHSEPERVEIYGPRQLMLVEGERPQFVAQKTDKPAISCKVATERKSLFHIGQAVHAIVPNGTKGAPIVHTGHRVVGLTSTGVCIAPTESVNQVDFALAKRGVAPRAGEWLPNKFVVASF